MKEKILMILLVIVLAAIIIFGVIYPDSMAESEYEGTKLYVTASRLNGRSMPRKKAFVEAIFDHGDQLTATGKWSRDHKWIEVYGGEGGTVWIDIRYVSEIKQPEVIMTDVSKIKIRKKPFDGKITGYLKHGREIEVDQVVLGWARCSKGWIDLGYCYFVETDEP